MIRPHLRDLPSVDFPPGYGIRPMMSVEEGGLWIRVQREAEPYLAIPDDLFHREFGYDPDSVSQRCFFIITTEGEPAGTISAWYDRNFRGQDYGRIHWVAVCPAHQRRGLARAALAFALRRLAQWHQRAYLVTSTRRIPAIRLYLQFGFRPDLEGPEAVSRWREVAAAIGDPTLAASLCADLQPGGPSFS